MVSQTPEHSQPCDLKSFLAGLELGESFPLPFLVKGIPPLPEILKPWCITDDLALWACRCGEGGVAVC